MEFLMEMYVFPRLKMAVSRIIGFRCVQKHWFSSCETDVPVHLRSLARSKACIFLLGNWWFGAPKKKLFSIITRFPARKWGVSST